MRRRNLLLGLLLPVLSVRALDADTFTYTYSGPEFNTIYNSDSDEPEYSSSDSVTATITLDTPIISVLSGGGFGQYSLDVVSYTFTDGVQTMTEDNSDPRFLFLTTDGQISDWEVDVQSSNGLLTISTYNLTTNVTDAPYYEDEGQDYYAGGALVNEGYITSPGQDPGQWVLTSETLSTPEPSTLTLLLGPTLILSAMRLQRKRHHAKASTWLLPSRTA